ncbi:MAG: (2Fe-2S)-binding protein [Myxococcales bacterium]|nr:(2Fe-2S)-binding protein [Myxococcales bacterium]
MPSRLKSLENPVEISHDGAVVPAERGEPLAVALIAADRLPLARSPKLHRPRGPYCLRGGCDGCLARVDGVPNVMTCLRATRGGEVIETQNVLGTRELDALRAADFLFPKGIDHHRLFAGIRGVSAVVQSFARRVAGLGTLPANVEPSRPATRRELEVLVIGGGLAGLSALAALDARAWLVDDGPSIGGAARALSPERLGELSARATANGGTLAARTTAIALYREPERPDGRMHVIALGPEGATLFVPRVVILATGRHEPVPAFGENELPGVYSAHAALALWRAGVTLGKRVAVVGGGAAADRYAELVAEQTAIVRFEETEVVRARGRSKVSGLVLTGEKSERNERVEAIVLGGRGSPALELAIQAGASAEFDALEAYRLRVDADGLVAPGVLAAGSLVGDDDAAVAGARAASRAKQLLGAG